MQTALIACSATICFFCLILSAVYVYRKRRRIGYFWYRRRLRKEREQRVLHQNYNYKAFVSYCDDNENVRNWVQTRLELEVEVWMGMNLFIPERNLDYGNLHLREIDAAMIECQKVILVLCPEYLEVLELSV